LLLQWDNQFGQRERRSHFRSDFVPDVKPEVGAEVQKTRPALILPNNIANEHSPITIVAAITSGFDDPY
jgi:hypothetical protein